jgi:hypothetical protein
MPPACRLSLARLLSSLCLFLPAAAWADKVFLKSGEEINGTILEETPDAVRVQILVGTIKDKKLIPRDTIDRIEKTSQEDLDYPACPPLKNTPDGLPAKNYEDRLKVINDFLTKYPTSKYLAEIQAIRDSLTAELAKVSAGQIRFRGTWLTPEQQVIHANQLEASTALRSMRQAAATRNFLVAMRQFETIEKHYLGTLAYPEALADVKRILPAYGKQLTDDLGYAHYDAEHNAKGLATLSDSARTAAQQEIAAVNKRFQDQVAAEKAKKVTWLSVDRKSEASINEAITRVRKEIDRIAKIDPAPFEQQAQAFYNASELIAAGKLDEAKAALTAAASIPGAAKLTPMPKASSSRPGTPPRPVATSTATPDRPSLLAALQMQLETRLADKQAQDAKAAEAAAAAQKATATVETAAKDPAAPMTGDDALNALVMQKSTGAPAAAQPGATTPAKPGAKPTASSAKPAASASTTRPAAAARRTAAEGDEESASARPRPPRAPVAQKTSSPFPIIVGLVTVCLVGATVFLYLQEQKKKGGGE